MRFTTQGKREAENLKNIAEGAALRGWGDVAIVADVHFAPSVAEVAALHADKVRINPGNYGGADDKFRRLIAICAEHGTAMRIGVNHGSLAADIVERWGDTPQGMVESAMQYLRVCREMNFNNVAVSMKASNVRVMVHAYRMLAAQMQKENMSYPLHLGVTEAGSGIEGRIKSAVGIGALLADGLGDTIRISLTEAPENEIPVARALIDYFAGREGAASEPIADETLYSPYQYMRRASEAVGGVGGNNTPVVWSELDKDMRMEAAHGSIALLESQSDNAPAEWRARILNMMSAGDNRPVILYKKYRETSPALLAIKAAADFAVPLIDGLADGIRIENDGAIGEDEIYAIALNILQASRTRISSAEFIACPGCGRTLFDLKSTLAHVKPRLEHLVGLKIAVMGCIVNGPGEMSDADYGYVGEGSGKVTLYRGKQIVERGIDQNNALDKLVELIKSDGRWIEVER
jgi:(E)-4-hydroxy-3-methylbut-2-enyl-diphosphate synthase